MKVPVYYVYEDEYYFAETGATTTINAAAAAEVIESLISVMLGEVGRHEENDPSECEDVLRKHGMIDDEYDPDDEENW